MKATDDDWRLTNVVQDDDEIPEVYAVVHGNEGYEVSRRALLTGLGAGVLAGCGKTEETPVVVGNCREIEAHSGWITAVAFSPDGTLLASGSVDKTIKLWSLPDGELLKTLAGHSKDVESVAFSPDGTLLASGGDSTVRLWSLPDGELLKILSGHSPTVVSVVFSPDGTLLASASRDKTIRLWSLPDGKPQKRLKRGHSADFVVFSPDGNLLVSAGFGFDVELWTLPDGKLLKILRGDTVDTSLAISPDGTLLAVGSGNALKLWQLPGGESFCLFDAARPGTKTRSYRQMGLQTLTLPCGSPIPAGAVCVCDCVSGEHRYTGTETVCVCDTVAVPATGQLPTGSECVCDTVAVATKEKTTRETPGTTAGGHYWYPN